MIFIKNKTILWIKKITTNLLSESIYDMNKWDTLVEYINKKNIGDIIFRGELISATNSKTNQNTSVDNQRNWLMNCGYLERIKIGQYKILKHIDIKLTSNEIKKRSYNQEYRINCERLEKLNTILNEKI